MTPSASGPKTIVVALGGNAVAPPGERATIANQFRHTRESLAPIVELARLGWRIALVHGNGPQVGDALARTEIAAPTIEPLPLGVLVAATAGWMGYMIQQSLQNALARAGISRRAVTLITQTRCAADDPELARPSKPIGHQPWQRLAPSPRPLEIVESAMVSDLVSAGHIVIACGGGGPPVYTDPGLGLEGIDAVVDKDRVAAILAVGIAADVLLILTNVSAVYRGYGTPHEERLTHLGLDDVTRLLSGNELGTGSMRPKVEAAGEFVRVGGGRAVIAELADGLAALDGRGGTTITRAAS